MATTVGFRQIGITGPVRLRDLWVHRNLGTFAGTYTTSVPGHGVVLLRVEY